MAGKVEVATDAGFDKFIKQDKLVVSSTAGRPILIFAVVIIGGAANSWGPVVGAAILVSVMEALRFMEISPLIVGFTRQIAYGMVLILFMCFRPQGFMGEFAARPKRDEKKPTPSKVTAIGLSHRGLWARSGAYSNRKYEPRIPCSFAWKG